MGTLLRLTPPGIFLSNLSILSLQQCINYRLGFPSLKLFNFFSHCVDGTDNFHASSMPDQKLEISSALLWVVVIMSDLFIYFWAGQMGNGFIGRWPPYINPHVVQTGEFGLAYRRLCELEFGHFKTCLQSKITHTLLCIFKCGLLSLSIYTCQVN